ncbi:neuronal acetylcholine receptor subunit beta-3-like [Ruditapes philippinarum]|uniref:neuronal acetylcholine receptor subunit beta-3-like n=1 Tax=Ruditapes philippinarum TaxID=129788 RepID=UPI00295BFC17|nr:neuronal acetylcholine receptor subunit beta-3-like [Ruditapes philippinarum]
MIKTATRYFFRIWNFANIVNFVHCQTYSDVTNLRASLLASYNPDVVPVSNYSAVLKVNLSATLFMMPEVDPVRGSVTMGIMIVQEWFDEIITWTPADHGGITYISMKSEDVWTPPVTVQNPFKFILLGQSWMQVGYQYNGKARYAVGDIMEFSCSFYMKYWPFDKQICSINFFPYGYAYNEVTFAIPGTVMNTNFYTKNGEWYLEKDSFTYSKDNDIGSTTVRYSFRISRQSLFYLLTIIIPINGIGALTCLVFLLPSESGERVSYSITIMLSLAVFLTVISDDLPKHSEPIPIMCVYILFNMVVCICGLIMVILNLALNHRSETTQISRFYKSLVNISCRRNKVGNESLVDSSDDLIKAISREKQGTAKQDFKKSKTRSRNTNGWVSNGPDVNITWKEVSRAIDKILFYVLVILTYVPSLVILVYIAADSDYNTQ